LKFAAIDIGSNAVRLLVEEIFETETGFHTQKVSFTRIPLRLGTDVFENGEISKLKAAQLIKVMKAFWHLMDFHNIKNYRACATSAMREAKNRKDVIQQVKKETKIEIEIIAGQEEANLIFGNFLLQDIDHSKNYLYIDVGGGSTELTVIKKGERIKAKSFEIGTVRMLQNKVKEQEWTVLNKWVQDLRKDEANLVGIATGGNINRIFKMSRHTFNEPLTFNELLDIRNFIQGFSLEDRMEKLGLKSDRADVIEPAAEIYLRILENANIQEMIVPRVGLSDGIILQLYQNWKMERLSI
jgi:exopolyphosphatase/guanosine-5'-triphosphate,3'-diphosphate pyrophosphatase